MTLVVDLVRTVPSAKFIKGLSPKWGQRITCKLTIIIVPLLSQFLCLIMLIIVLRLKCDLHEHFFGN